jgi:hypothetical protein
MMISNDIAPGQDNFFLFTLHLIHLTYKKINSKVNDNVERGRSDRESDFIHCNTVGFFFYFRYVFQLTINNSHKPQISVKHC